MLTKRLQTLSSAPVWAFVGMEISSAGDGYADVTLKVKNELLQLFGNVHGGILATLIDASMAAALNTILNENEYSVTVEMKVNYLKPGTGECLLGKGEVIKRGKTLTFCKSEILDEHNQLIAFGVGTFFTRTKQN